MEKSEVNAAEMPIAVTGLHKNFGSRKILRDISFTVAKGEILGILGPNGAGKSTLIGVLSGLLEPDSGHVELFGMKFNRHRAAILARMNIASPYAGLPTQLTVRQNLSIYAGLYGLSRPNERIEELTHRFGISVLADTRVGKLSSGQTVRVNLCKALLNRPELLLLDEPTVYLDPEMAAQTRALILEERAARAMTILLTSHNLEEIEHLCDRIVLLNHGRIAACGTKLEVTRAVLGPGYTRPALDEVFFQLVRAPA